MEIAGGGGILPRKDSSESSFHEELRVIGDTRRSANRAQRDERTGCMIRAGTTTDTAARRSQAKRHIVVPSLTRIVGADHSDKITVQITAVAPVRCSQPSFKTETFADLVSHRDLRSSSKSKMHPGGGEFAPRSK